MRIKHSATLKIEELKHGQDEDEIYNNICLSNIKYFKCSKQLIYIVLSIATSNQNTAIINMLQIFYCNIQKIVTKIEALIKLAMRKSNVNIRKPIRGVTISDKIEFWKLFR